MTDDAQTGFGQTVRPSSSKNVRSSLTNISMTAISTSKAVAEAFEALIHLRDEHGAITPADVADAVIAHDLDDAEAEILTLELDAHGAAPEQEEEPERRAAEGGAHDATRPRAPASRRWRPRRSPRARPPRPRARA